MLPAASRLKKDRDFARVLRVGRKVLCGPLLVFSAPGETSQARFGVTVSKKVSAKAVERNKVRRQLAQLLRPIAEGNPTNQDVVFVVLRLAEFDEYQNAISLWQKKP